MTRPFEHPSAHDGRALTRRDDSLADLLERVLDKGIVITGDVRVDLLDIELLTIRIRLMITSADKAEELGMAWWRNDPFFTGELPSGANGRADRDGGETRALERLAESTERLERRVAELEGRSEEDSSRSVSAERAEARDGD